jgi:glycosyltransferase involved in cell wall biosynthesis
LGNVADIEHFAVAREKGTLPPEIAAIPEPRLGYVGVLSDFKIDFGMLETLATEHRDWHFVFIGEEREGQRSEAIARMKQQPNAHFLGWKPYEQLPRYLSGLSVGLLPQLINEYTRAMFPMKFFEYIAAGLPVVSTPLPALRDFQSLYQVGNDVVGFANAITTVLSGNGSSIPAPHDPILQNNSWAVRLERMLALIEATA